MVKRKNDRLTSDAPPTATNVDFPIFVPNDEGDTTIEVGRGRLRFGTLVIEMNNKAVSVAVQKAIARGALLGLGFVMVEPDVVNEMYQDIVEKEANPTPLGEIVDDREETVNPDVADPES